MDRLNQLMKSTDTKNYHLAKVLGVNEGAIRFWRKGRSIPRKGNLNALAAYFNVQPAWLLYGDRAYAPTPVDKLAKIFEDAERYITEDPDALSYIERMLRGLIGTRQFQPNPVPKKRKRQRPA